MRVWIVLPAYNEAENLPAIFHGIVRLAAENPQLEPHVVLVDDGSRDGTLALAREAAKTLPMEILENGVNRGLAETFARGMTAAASLAADEDVLVCMDADNSHLPGEIPRMLQRLREGLDVVIASRYRKGAVIRGVSLLRRWLSGGMSLLFRLAYPVPGVRDYSCGYRAYAAGFFKAALARRGEGLFVKEGFACMVGMLLRLHKQGAIFGEVPMVLRYDQKAGPSKMKLGGTILKTLGVLLRERFGKP